jgi:hypothetical protein
MRNILLALALLVAGCGSPQMPEPCTPEAIAMHAGTCQLRIRLECKPKPDGSKDLDCPAFVECNKQSLEEETRCNAQ